MLLSARVTLRHRAVAYPGVGLPYRGVRLPSSSWGRVARRWACPQQCGHALPQRSPPFGVEARRWAAHVVVGYPTSAFASSRCRRVAYLGVRLLSLSWGCVLRHWAAHVVVGSPRAAFASPRGRVVSDFLRWCSRCRGVWTSALSWGWRRAGVGGVRHCNWEKRTAKTGHDESRGPFS